MRPWHLYVITSVSTLSSIFMHHRWYNMPRLTIRRAQFSVASFIVFMKEYSYFPTLIWCELSWFTRKNCQYVPIITAMVPFLTYWVFLGFLVVFFCFSKFDLGNPRSRSWARSKFKVTKWVRLSIGSHSFRSIAISHPIPGIQFLSTVFIKTRPWKPMLKLIAQMVSGGSNVLSNHDPFVPCLSLSDFENPSSMSWVWSKFKVTQWVIIMP